MGIDEDRTASHRLKEAVAMLGRDTLRRLAVACAIAVIAGAPTPSFSQTPQAGKPDAAASATLEGTVTLACGAQAPTCKEQPYQVELSLQEAQRQRPAQMINVSRDGTFSISVPPATYVIISADTRGSCCLPTLQPVTVTVTAGRISRVNLRFEPGLELPTR